MEDVNMEPTHTTAAAGMANNASESKAPTNFKDHSDDGRPPSGQQAQQVPEPESLDSDEEESEEEVDPADQIEDFDWDGLHEKYHTAMNNASAQENALMQEFAQLMDVKNDPTPSSSLNHAS